MNIDWNLFFSAVALAAVLEAVPYVLAPDRMRQFLTELGQSDSNSLRHYGLTMLGAGLIALFLVRRVFA